VKKKWKGRRIDNEVHNMMKNGAKRRAKKEVGNLLKKVGENEV